MIYKYLIGIAPRPQPALGGSIYRPRPLIAVRITGPTGTALRDGALDTGADDAVFPEYIGYAIGVDFTKAVLDPIHLAGRGNVPCRYASVTLRITDGIQETYEWTAVVGFVPDQYMSRPLLGYAGFLQFFDAEFRGADKEVHLKPNHAFPGRRI